MILSGALAWGMSAARIRGLATRAPLDSLRAPPPTPNGLAAAGWGAALLVVLAAAWSRAPTGADAVKIVGALAAGGLAIYENALFERSENLFVLNERIFTANMGFSVVFLGTTLAGYLSR